MRGEKRETIVMRKEEKEDEREVEAKRKRKLIPICFTQPLDLNFRLDHYSVFNLVATLFYPKTFSPTSKRV